jgi:hypothetical protein
LKIVTSAICQNKVQGLGELNEALKNHGKMKNDTIAQLSDQLLAISTRLQELERKQSSNYAKNINLWIAQ